MQTKTNLQLAAMYLNLLVIVFLILYSVDLLSSLHPVFISGFAVFTISTVLMIASANSPTKLLNTITLPLAFLNIVLLILSVRSIFIATEGAFLVFLFPLFLLPPSVVYLLWRAELKGWLRWK